jgi:hypothetical protein
MPGKPAITLVGCYITLSWAIRLFCLCHGNPSVLNSRKYMAIVILGVCRKPYMLQDFIFGLWLTTILKHPSHGRSNSDTFDTDFDTRVLMNRKNGQKKAH